VSPFTEAALTPHDAEPVADAVRRAQRGDVDAFETIYHASAPAIFALCRRMTGGDDREARELVQDVFVRAWERLATFRGESALATWLHRLAVNLVLERLRASRRDAARLVEGDDWAHPLALEAAELDARLDLDTAMARLPAGARMVLVLHLEGFSHGEISRLTGIAAGTARAQLWRARRALAKWLRP
jgi:RNA polymerase sigma-70 factor (ECF subfamily)